MADLRSFKMRRSQSRSLTSRLFECLYYVTLTAASRELTSICLAPIYGSLNAQHPLKWVPDIITLLTLHLIVIMTNLTSYQIDLDVHVDKLSSMITVLGSSQATFLSYASQLSTKLGPQSGPVLARLLSSFFLPMAVVPFTLLAWHEQTYAPHVGKRYWRASQLVMIYVVYGLFFVIEHFLQWLLYRYQSTLFAFGSYGMQALLSAAFAMCSRRLWLPTSILFIFALSSVHIQLRPNIPRLNTYLAVEGYSVIDRQESITGYISVLDNLKAGFRVLRCDHSLLGGEWIRYPEGVSPRLREPIYAIFVTLEAVRLAQTRSSQAVQPKPVAEQKALMIGLGIGTSAASFVGHGISTTIVEIDPVVHQFATQYFNLPSNHTPVIEDALTFVTESAVRQVEAYDYIIHDVFTGGAEPLELFTKDFIKGLSRVLSTDGTIAINYAGDLLRPSAASAVKTALAVFPTCRLFRETAPSKMQLEQDMANMVIFCRKTKEPFDFRQPVEADFLGSSARKEFLFPRFEVFASDFMNRAGEILTESSIKRLRASQRHNARTHWHFMRQVIPAKVWETW